MARQDAFFKGEFFGLPTKVLHTPFGRDSKCKDETGLTESQLAVLVALVAAEFAQVTPVTASEVEALVPHQPRPRLLELTKLGFIEVVGKAPKRTTRLYKPTAKAWREFGFIGWSLKEVA